MRCSLIISSHVALQLAQILPTEENFLICFREFVGSSSEFMAVSWHIYTSVCLTLIADMQQVLLYNQAKLTCSSKPILFNDCKELAFFLLCFF